MTDRPWVVRSFSEEDDIIYVICREKTRLDAEYVCRWYNDFDWSVDVKYDPEGMWVEPDENHWVREHD